MDKPMHNTNTEMPMVAHVMRGQMLDQVLKLFEIVPDHDLDVMQDSQSPVQVAAAVPTELEPVLRTECPDWVLVQGDTTTVVAAAIVVFYARAKVGHVEAGLRSFDRTMRPVAISEGTNQLVGLSPSRIRDSALRALADGRPAGRCPELWDGRAAERIVAVLHEEAKL